MTYILDFSKKAEKQFDKLSRRTQEQISAYIEKYFGENPKNPRSHGKALTGNLKGLWCYRINDYRIICEIKDNICTVLVVKVGHRREVYD